MNPYRRYAKTEQDTGSTRIELLLSLYDNALERLDKAEAALRAKDTSGAVGQLIKTQNVIIALAAGVRVQVSPELNTNVLRLYEYAVTELRRPDLGAIGNVRKVLRTLREGFEAIRAEANDLERSGRVSPVENATMVITSA